MITKTCEKCGESFETRLNRTRYCGRKCYFDARAGKSLAEYDAPKAGWKNYRWAGGYKEHRLVMARKLGRPLRPGEIVHHIDGNRFNNDPDNLELKSGPIEHNKAHDKTFRSETEKECTQCHRILPNAAFYTDKAFAKTWDQRSGECKECHSKAVKESNLRRAKTWQRKYTEEQLAVMTRRCSRCAEEKPISGFYRSNDLFRQVPVRQPCIECCKARYQAGKGQS